MKRDEDALAADPVPIAAPSHIRNGAELAVALRAIKQRSGLSFRQIEAQAPPGSAQALPVSTVEGWFASRNLPSKAKLRVFLRVCGLPDREHLEWLTALDRVKNAPGLPTIDTLDPVRQLGVHQAIHVDTSDSARPALTPYVVRDHDQKLREELRSGRGNQLVVLTGGSSVGKTRACYEAVRAVLPGWPVIHPLTAEELLALLVDGVVPGSVVWLNETQRYLQPPQGRAVAVALQRLLQQTDEARDERIVVLGSMWLSPYWQDLTRPPQPREPDPQPEVRDLLTRMCVRVDVAEDFQDLTPDQRDDLERLAERDPRLAAAIAASGTDARVSQVLAHGRSKIV